MEWRAVLTLLVFFGVVHGQQEKKDQIGLGDPRRLVLQDFTYETKQRSRGLSDLILITQSLSLRHNANEYWEGTGWSVRVEREQTTRMDKTTEKLTSIVALECKYTVSSDRRDKNTWILHIAFLNKFIPDERLYFQEDRAWRPIGLECEIPLVGGKLVGDGTELHAKRYYRADSRGREVKEQLSDSEIRHIVNTHIALPLNTRLVMEPVVLRGLDHLPRFVERYPQPNQKK